MVTLRSEKARRGCTTNYEVKGAATASSQPHYLSLPRPSHAIPLEAVESCAFGKKLTYMEIVLKYVISLVRENYVLFCDP